MNQNWKFRTSKKFLLKERQKQRFLEEYSNEIQQYKLECAQKEEEMQNNKSNFDDKMKMFFRSKMSPSGARIQEENEQE